MYTMSEFRNNLRQAFRDAREGHEVVIGKYDELYQLVALVKEPLPGHTMESVPGKAAKFKDKQIAEAVDKAINDGDLEELFEEHNNNIVLSEELPVTDADIAVISGPVCKVDGTKLDANGRCLQKGCKYA